jgi:hypothetical protein
VQDAQKVVDIQTDANSDDTTVYQPTEDVSPRGHQTGAELVIMRQRVDQQEKTSMTVEQQLAPMGVEPVHMSVVDANEVVLVRSKALGQ